MIKRKRAQEEMIGFVAVLVLIAIIFLAFIGFSTRQKPPETGKEINTASNLLGAMLDATTDCAVSFEPEFSTVRDLIKDCYYKSKCLNGRDACQYLMEVVEGMLVAAEGDLSMERERQFNYFEFNASYAISPQQTFERRPSADLVYVKRGKCSGISVGTQQFMDLISDSGQLDVSLVLCYGK